MPILNFGCPSATKGKGGVDFLPEELPELRRYVNLPDVRQVVKDIHPSHRKTMSPVTPTRTGIDQLFIEDGAGGRTIQDNFSQKGKGLVVQHRACIHPVGGHLDGGQGENVSVGKGCLLGKLVSQGIVNIPIVGLHPLNLDVPIMTPQEVQQKLEKAK